MPEETAVERYQRLATETAEAYREAFEPPLGPDSKVVVERTRATFRVFTVANLAHELRVPISAIIDHGKLVTSAANLVNTLDWSDPEVDFEEWKLEEAE
jgi:signal transduction histidine kinase